MSNEEKRVAVISQQVGQGLQWWGEWMVKEGGELGCGLSVVYVPLMDVIRYVNLINYFIDSSVYKKYPILWK